MRWSRKSNKMQIWVQIYCKRQKYMQNHLSQLPKKTNHCRRIYRNKIIIRVLFHLFLLVLIGMMTLSTVGTKITNLYNAQILLPTIKVMLNLLNILLINPKKMMRKTTRVQNSTSFIFVLNLFHSIWIRCLYEKRRNHSYSQRRTE